MDLNKLREMSQEGQDGIAKQILEKCDPKKIAQELMSKLEKNATEAAKKGECKAYSHFNIWQKTGRGETNLWISRDKIWKYENNGPLVDFPDREKASKILLTMVQEHVKDKNIQLELRKYDYKDDNNFEYVQYISASMEW